MATSIKGLQQFFSRSRLLALKHVEGVGGRVSENEYQRCCGLPLWVVAGGRECRFVFWADVGCVSSFTAVGLYYFGS